jgi:hypothetical protein
MSVAVGEGVIQQWTSIYPDELLKEMYVGRALNFERDNGERT